MRIKYRLLGIFLLTALLSVLALLHPLARTQATAGDKSYTAQHIEEQIAIQNDGSLLINETITFHFNGGPFTYVFRELPTTKTDGVEVLATKLDGQEMSEGSSAGQAEITGDNPIRVTWHFAPTTDATHTFMLSYRVDGATQKTAQSDLLDWVTLPTPHSYPISTATVTVTYPQKASLMGTPTILSNNGRVESTPDHRIIFQASNLGTDESLEIGLNFQAGSIITTTPQWQQAEEHDQEMNTNYLPLFLGGSLVILFGSSFLLFRYRRRARGKRTRIRNTFALTPTSALPDDLPPAIAGTLVQGMPDKASWYQALATLFDLANRGVVHIKEKRETSKRYKKNKFSIRWQKPATALLPYEQTLLLMLFSGSKEFDFADASGRYANKASEFSSALADEMQKRELYDRNEAHVHNVLIHMAIVLFCIGFMALFITIMIMTIGNSHFWVPIFLPISLLALGFIAARLGAQISPLTDEGLRAASRWRAFSYSISRIAYGATHEHSLDDFERYLPYATSFGHGQRWIEHFQKRGLEKVPPWFAPSDIHDTRAAHIDSFVAMGHVASYQPASSSGGSSSGSFGGGGFSGGGGGASGAG